MKFYSRYENPIEFAKLKRRKRGKWSFLAAGDWSQSPYHQGNLRFYYALTIKGDYCVLMSIGFPTRIVCIGTLEDKTRLTEVMAAMLFHLRVHGGDLMDSVDDGCNDELDFKVVWNQYRTLVKESRNKG